MPFGVRPRGNATSKTPEGARPPLADFDTREAPDTRHSSLPRGAVRVILLVLSRP